MVHFPGNVIAWKFRDHIKPGEEVTISAQHRFGGGRGELRYVVFESIGENFNPPKFVIQSDLIKVSEKDRWSHWTFVAEHAVIFVGIAWEKAEVPIYIQREKWTNPTVFNDYAYKGIFQNKTRPLDSLYVPVKANFKVVRGNRSTPPQQEYFWTICIASFLLIIYFWFSQRAPNDIDLLYFLTGIIFAYRIEAYSLAPYWTWGGYYVSFLPEIYRNLLLVLFLAIVFVFPFLSNSLFRKKLPSSLLLYSALVFLFIALAWNFQCNRQYHDWIYSITNHDHAPLTSSIFQMATLAVSSFKRLSDALPRLFSIIVCIPFLFFLRALVVQVDESEKLSLWGMLFFLSLSTTQLFFAYVGIHSFPMLYWILFCYLSFRVLDGKGGLFLPSFVSFLAYMSHVSEAFLIFPLIFLWLNQIHAGKLRWSKGLKLVCLLFLTTIGITAFTYYTLFLFKFNGEVDKFTGHYTHYGFEILWGSMKHSDLLLPYFDISNYPGSYTPPGPRYATISLDNLVRVFNTGFHFSAFCMFLPILLMVKSRGADLRNSKVKFCFIAFTAYLIYMFVAYVGWIPVIRDWDLFAIFSVISATLLYLLLMNRKMYRSIALIALINFLQTVPWIILNHYSFPLPW